MTPDSARPPAGALRAVRLRPETARWWVEGGPAVPDPDGMTAHIRDFLAVDATAALWAAVEGDRSLARMQTMPVGSCGMGLFAVGLGDDLSDADSARAADALLIAARAHAAGVAGVRYLETDVPSQAPFHAAWRAALSRHGVAEVAASRAYERAIGEPAPVAGDRLRYVAVAELPDAVVASIYAATYAETADAVHQHSPEPFDARLGRLKQVPLLAPDVSGWRVAFDGNEPVGLVFAALECAPHGRAHRGWILEIGVMPNARGRGLGRKLLHQGLMALAERGVTQVLARIDDLNAPSVRLFSAADFQPQAERSWLHRAVW